MVLVCMSGTFHDSAIEIRPLLRVWHDASCMTYSKDSFMSGVKNTRQERIYEWNMMIHACGYDDSCSCVRMTHVFDMVTHTCMA